MDVISITNTIRSQQDAMYQERIPAATITNLETVGNALMSYATQKNQFLDAFINKVAFTMVSNRRFKNPLSILKKGVKPYGTDIEDVYTNPVKGETFSGDAFDGTGKSKLLKVTKPDTKTMYHRMNRQDVYPISISNQQLRKAFTSPQNLESFYNSIITAMYSGDEMDEYLLMRNTVSKAVADGKIVSVEVEYDGSETACKDLIKLIKTFSGDMTFPSKAFNGYNLLNKTAIEGKTLTPVTTWTPAENQVLLIRNDVDKATDVEVLAKAFNLDKAEFLKRKIVVDTFGDDNPDVLCVIGDEALFQTYDDEYELKSFDNGSNLTMNFWLHHWQTISLQLWANAIAIKQKAA